MKMNRLPPNRRMIGGNVPSTSLVPSRQPQSYSQPGPAPQPQLGQSQDFGMGDPGLGMGNAVTGAQLRKALEGLERRVNDQLSAFAGDTNARLEDIFRTMPQAGVTLGNPADALAGLGEQVRQAIVQGKCQFYALSTDVYFDAGEVDVRKFGGVIMDSAGPFFIVKMLAYAQIQDEAASNYPFSLLDSPSCSASTPTAIGANCDTAATSFAASCSTIIPKIDGNGAYIPISPRNCRLITAGTETCCFTQTCPDGTVNQFSGKVPIVLLDHFECVDGITEVNLNGCMWDNVPFPLAFWEDAMFDFTDSAPSCVGVCGYLDCQKQLDISLTLTRALRYNVDVQFVLAGFRIFSCV
jgi:hypothetical protein